MTVKLTSRAAALGLAAGCLFSGAAAAQGAVPYPNTGFQNNASYSFTAAATGDVDAYFAAQTNAGYAEAKATGTVGGR